MLKTKTKKQGEAGCASRLTACFCLFPFILTRMKPGSYCPKVPGQMGGGLRPRPSRAVPAARLPFELHGDILEPVVYSQVLSQLRAADFHQAAYPFNSGAWFPPSADPVRKLFVEKARQDYGLVREYGDRLLGFCVNKIEAGPRSRQSALTWHVDDGAGRPAVSVACVYVMYDTNVDDSELAGGSVHYWATGLAKYNRSPWRPDGSAKHSPPAGSTSSLAVRDNCGYCFCGSAVPHCVDRPRIAAVARRRHARAARAQPATDMPRPYCTRYSAVVWFSCKSDSRREFRAMFGDNE